MSETSHKATWERRSDDAKKRHRPSLKDWGRDGFASKRSAEFLALRTLGAHLNTNIARVDCSKLSVEEFRRRFEGPNVPCVIQNVPTSEGWTAGNHWTFSQLKARYGDCLFKCGEDDDGYKIKMKMKYFLQYTVRNQDDSPLYIFDSNFYGNKDTKDMMDDFSVPKYFTEDLFKLTGEHKRPPYRWFLIGPERSGTTVHIDPLGTSAWNTSLSGRKRWVLFPPGTEKRVAKGIDVKAKGEDDEAVHYFTTLLPRTRQTHKDLQIIEFIQEAGDTVYIPGGWWHGVINLDDTVAITQNFCSSLNFPRVWKETRSGRKRLAVRWLRKLRSHSPLLAKQADDLNKEDDFMMYDERKRRGLVKAKKRKHKDKEKKEDGLTDCEDKDSTDSCKLGKKRKMGCC